MTLTVSGRALTATAVTAAAVTVTAAAAIAAPGGGGAARAGLAKRPSVIAHDGALTRSQQRAAARYWTPARMKAALPQRESAAGDAAARDAWLDGDSQGRGLRWVHGGTVEQATGKVFFTLNGTDYACSGTVIRSPDADVVLTAAHCVGDGGGDWATNWTFVPGYRDGTGPYGAFTARRFFVSPQWEDAGGGSAGAEGYDFAFVTVNPPVATDGDGDAPGNGGAAGVPGMGGPPGGLLPPGLPVAFGGLPRAATAYVFGYPAEPPFSGLYSDYCAGPATAAPVPGTTGLRCAMTAGDSGGPWLAGFDPRTGTGTVVAVTAFKYGGDMSVLYGTALGPAARELYQEASALASG